MHNFKELNVWKKARTFSKDIYSCTATYPNEEKFGLTGQLSRAVVSISANIAEGSGRGTDSEMCRFLDIACGSTFEVESLLYLSLDLGYLAKADFENLNAQAIEIGKMLCSLKQTLQRTKAVQSQV